MSYDFDSIQLKEVTGPGTYIFYVGTAPVYIGATSHGLFRCCRDNHVVFKHYATRELTLTFIPARTASEAFDLETELIEVFKPELNWTPKDDRRRYKNGYRARREEFWKQNPHLGID